MSAPFTQQWFTVNQQPPADSHPPTTISDPLTGAHKKLVWGHLDVLHPNGQLEMSVMRIECLFSDPEPSPSALIPYVPPLT